jgi:hypothetical protein
LKNNNVSKVVDENGEPLVVYHGSKNKFDTFDINAKREHDLGVYGKGFYFTVNKNTADSYGEHNSLYPVYLNIKEQYNVSEDLINNFGNFNSIE